MKIKCSVRWVNTRKPHVPERPGGADGYPSPLKDLDQQMSLDWAVASDIAVLVLLTKADKLAWCAQSWQVNMVREAVLAFNGDVQVEPFSSLKAGRNVNCVRSSTPWLSA